ncbi:spliceosome-associated protein CWC27 homolog [Centruroides vittatus]|uniref:spliceosome-associated protein CWC27 homolog n=1 Tax=Centruroides vittatus TaxID=120091 RepID=UPI00350FCC4B
MSNIYIQEPPTLGKVLLKTTVGDIDIELWAKETPKACRNFVQLCMEGYYDGTIFHRVVKGFLAQGGDPTGTGEGGESIYGEPFKDEFHSRLRFVRRGLVAMATSQPNDNESQFFFTLGACPELQNKHTIFGKVTGKTLYNMLKLEESLVDKNERPYYPHKIIETKILSNPFNDIVPREKTQVVLEVEEKPVKSKPSKNFNLLSFGEEAEEEEAEDDLVAQEFRGKSKSSHDLANDPHLSSMPAVVDDASNDSIELDTNTDKNKDINSLDNIRKKLQKTVNPKSTDDGPKTPENEEYEKRKEIRREIKKLKRELKEEDKKVDNEDEEMDTVKREPTDNELLEAYHNELDKRKKMKKIQKQGNREETTLALLAKFQARLKSAREENADKDDKVERGNEDDDDDEDGGDGWLRHQLYFEDKGPVLAKDASIKTEDTYEIFDPRNPINLRRREASKKAMKKHH